jgi:hypothetical protein
MDLECPYCETELEVCHDDGFGYEEGVKHQMECSNCEKSFVFETSISFYYEPEKADCLNDGKHKWKPQTSYPKEFTKMECQSCGDTRNPTEDEMKEILSETVS